tara:strand:- start:1095 stop:1484 length:390 start_codon:yes stop_codon:yes gene_type:complete
MIKYILLVIVLTTTLPAQITRDFTFKDNSTNEDGFIVERKVDGGEYMQFLTLQADVAAFSDGDIPVNSVVMWRVKAYNEFGDSGFTNTVSVITMIPVSPTELVVLKKNPVARYFQMRKYRRHIRRTQQT